MLLYNSRRLTPPTSSGAGGREAGGNSTANGQTRTADGPVRPTHSRSGERALPAECRPRPRDARTSPRHSCTIWFSSLFSLFPLHAVLIPLFCSSFAYSRLRLGLDTMTLLSREISHWAVDDSNFEICQFSKFCRYGMPRMRMRIAKLGDNEAVVLTESSVGILVQLLTLLCHFVVKN